MYGFSNGVSEDQSSSLTQIATVDYFDLVLVLPQYMSNDITQQLCADMRTHEARDSRGGADAIRWSSDALTFSNFQVVVM